MERLQALYDSEINCKLAWFWDGGINWYLGDELNGYKAQGYSLTLREAVSDLSQAAIKQYPNSTFTKNFRFQGKGK